MINRLSHGIFRGNPRMGPIHFVKTIHVLLKWTLFLAGPHIQAIQISCQVCSNGDMPIKFCKGPIKISNGPLKFANLHVFEWDMGHHHSGLGLSLHFCYHPHYQPSTIISPPAKAPELIMGSRVDT